MARTALVKVPAITPPLGAASEQGFLLAVGTDYDGEMRTSCHTVLLAVGLSTGIASAQSSSTPGEPEAPYPTFEAVSLSWPLDGDDNGNGVVRIRYRIADGEWMPGLDLTRVQAGSNAGFSWPTRHAGSLFGLSPGTRYQVELTLEDPDGGGSLSTLEVQTRAYPTVPNDATRVAATPQTIASILENATPGTVIELSPGNYEEIVVPNDGAPNQPIVVRAEGDGVEVLGDVRLDSRAHVWVSGLHVGGKIKFNNSRHIVIAHNRVEATAGTGDGIVAYGLGTESSYIADNTVIGGTTWTESALGVSGNNIGEGIVVTGPGNVIAHNLVRGFRDCISLLEGDEATEQRSIDIVGNDLDTCADDGIEADFAMGNVRVVGNRITNTFMALSSQPSLGGPTYFIRNAIFNVVFQAFKPNRASVGDVWFHNTVVKQGDALGVYTDEVWSHAVFRNNLLIGGGPGGTYNGFASGSGRIIQVPSLDDTTSTFDYDGYGSVGATALSGQLSGFKFESLAELASKSFEVHASEVSMDVFREEVTFPAKPFPALVAPDLRLQPGAAVDKGISLPSINDGFVGAAPDLGAYELDAPPPVYGPRDPVPCPDGSTPLSGPCPGGEPVSTGGSAGGGGGAGSAGTGGQTTAGSLDQSGGPGPADPAEAMAGGSTAAQAGVGDCGCALLADAPGSGQRSWPIALVPLALLYRLRRHRRRHSRGA